MAKLEQTPQEEAADWATWLDRFETYIWPIFARRGYTRDAAMTTYFTRIADEPGTWDDGEEEHPFG